MRRLLIILVISGGVALLLYGYYVMKKLDDYLSGNSPEQQKNLLRIAVEYAGMEMAVQKELERMAQQYPDTCLRLYCGTKQHILALLQSDQVDMILLSGRAHFPAFGFLVREYSTEHHRSESTGLWMEPVDAGQEVTIVWKDASDNAVLNAFTAWLSDGKS